MAEKKTTNLYEKLIEVQGEIGAIKKDAKNPFFKSNYFDINTLLSVVKPILSKYRIIILQPIVTKADGRNALQTVLMDADDGEKQFFSEMFLPQIEDPQKLGGAITYFRRYAIQALLALEAEDDDGNTASGKAEFKPRFKAPAKADETKTPFGPGSDEEELP